MSDPDRDPGLDALDVLVGTWTTASTHPSLDGVVAGRVAWSWLEGGRFLVQRTWHDHELVPDSLSVIGPPEGGGGGLVSEYFDSRGVRRTYGLSCVGGVLRLWRAQVGFDQHFAATLGEDAFEGLWQLAREPGAWRDDLRTHHERA